MKGRLKPLTPTIPIKGRTRNARQRARVRMASLARCHERLHCFSPSLITAFDPIFGFVDFIYSSIRGGIRGIKCITDIIETFPRVAFMTQVSFAYCILGKEEVINLCYPNDNGTLNTFTRTPRQSQVSCLFLYYISAPQRVGAS